MNKKIIIVLLILVLVIGVAFFLNNNDENNENNNAVTGTVLEIATAENLDSIITQVNEKANLQLASLATNIMDATDADSVKYYTGLQSNENVEHVVVSEPMMSSQAYSFVLVKAKDGADVEAMKKEMIDNIDTRKWICVEAEKVYVTNHSNLIALVMADTEWTTSVYNAFKEVVGQNVGETLEKTAEVAELPENDGLVDVVPNDDTQETELPQSSDREISFEGASGEAAAGGLNSNNQLDEVDNVFEEIPLFE